MFWLLESELQFSILTMLSNIFWPHSGQIDHYVVKYILITMWSNIFWLLGSKLWHPACNGRRTSFLHPFICARVRVFPCIHQVCQLHISCMWKSTEILQKWGPFFIHLIHMGASTRLFLHTSSMSIFVVKIDSDFTKMRSFLHPFHSYARECASFPAYIKYCHSHNNWGPRNSFQRFLVPVYYWKTVEKPETGPQLLWE